MNDQKFKHLITNITVILNNYLNLAKQSGTITITLDAFNGDVKKCAVTNTMLVKLEEDSNG